MPLEEFKALVREQFNILLIDTDKALAGIPGMLPHDVEARRMAFGLIKTALSARGDPSAEDKKKLGEIARLFDLDAEVDAASTSLSLNNRPLDARAS